MYKVEKVWYNSKKVCLWADYTRRKHLLLPVIEFSGKDMYNKDFDKKKKFDKTP